MSMGKFKLALKDYEAVAKYKPNDPDNKKKLAQCKKVQILRFKKKMMNIYIRLFNKKRSKERLHQRKSQKNFCQILKILK